MINTFRPFVVYIFHVGLFYIYPTVISIWLDRPKSWWHDFLITESPYLLCLKTRLQFEGPRTSLSKVSSKLKCLTTRILLLHSLSHASCYRVTLNWVLEWLSWTNSNEHCNTNASKRRKENITIAHLNARSIKNRNHFILLKDAVRAKMLDVLTVSETWLDSSVPNSEIEMEACIRLWSIISRLNYQASCHLSML